MGQEERLQKCISCNQRKAVVPDPFCSECRDKESGTQFSRKAPGSWTGLLSGLKRDGLIPQAPSKPETRRGQDS